MPSYMDDTYLDGVQQMESQLAGSGVTPQQVVEMAGDGMLTDAGDSVVIAGFLIKKRTLVIVAIVVFAGLLWMYLNKPKKARK